MAVQDLLFDHLALTFNQQIYQGAKGQLRLATQQRAICECILRPATAQLHFLDLGGGAGQMAAWLLEQGQQVTYSEPSPAMYQAGVALLAPLGARCLPLRYQDLNPDLVAPVDVVMINAVLEWLVDPKAALRVALQLLRPGGYLVLMSYNRDALRMRRLLRGHWQQALTDLPGDGTGLTPISLFTALDAKSWLEELGLELLDWRGIRTVTDWLPGKHSIADLLTLDAQLQCQDPWRQLGRYQHFIARRSALACEA